MADTVEILRFGAELKVFPRLFDQSRWLGIADYNFLPGSSGPHRRCE
jgi:hypothetical protein